MLLDETDPMSTLKKSRKRRTSKKHKSRLKHGKKAEKLSPYSHISNNRVSGQLAPTKLTNSLELGQIQAFVKPMKVLAANPKKFVRHITGPTPPVKLRMSLPQTNILHKSNITPTRVAFSMAPTVLDTTPRGSILQAIASPRPLGDIARLRTTVGEETFGRMIKVFLSERQSNSMMEMGVEMPCAPPTTPMPDVLRKYEYIPSMGDIRVRI